jgi:hypothetical protein
VLLTLFLSCFICYDAANLILYTNECALLMQKWLLITHVVILLMKILLFVLDCLNEETTCSLNTMKIVGFVFYMVLYPFLILWNVLGTFWFIRIEANNNECVRLNNDARKTQ